MYSTKIGAVDAKIDLWEDDMIQEPFFINTCGARKVPISWQQRPSIEMQRLYLIRGGRGYFLHADGTPVPFVRDTFYVFPHNLKARFFSDAADPIDHVFFDFLSAPPIVAPRPLVYPAGDSPLRELAALLTAVWRDEPPEEERKRLGFHLLRVALAMLDDIAPLPYCADGTVCAALDAMHRRYAEPVTISELAGSLHFEENYFIRRFKAVMGQTPYAYLRAYRLMRAEELLLRGCTLAQAAVQVGYENPSSLARALRTRGGK